MTKEELTRLHKAKCRRLKEMRAFIAKDLGIDLHQTECTFEGDCSGTCPRCAYEEQLLNEALARKNSSLAGGKSLLAKSAVLAATLSLSSCFVDKHIQGDMDNIDASHSQKAATFLMGEPAKPLTGKVAVPDKDSTVDTLQSKNVDSFPLGEPAKPAEDSTSVHPKK